MIQRTVLAVAISAVAIGMTACSHAVMMIHGTGAKRPAVREFATLADVLDHYNRAPAAVTGHSELRRLRLKAVELRQLEAFLRTLSGPVVVSERAPASRTH